MRLRDVYIVSLLTVSAPAPMRDPERYVISISDSWLSLRCRRRSFATESAAVLLSCCQVMSRSMQVTIIQRKGPYHLTFDPI